MWDIWLKHPDGGTTKAKRIADCGKSRTINLNGNMIGMSLIVENINFPAIQLADFSVWVDSTENLCCLVTGLTIT